MTEAERVEPNLLTTAEECLDQFRGSAPDWADRAGIWSKWVFRGVGDSRYELLPSAVRPPGAEVLDPLRERVPAIVEEWEARNRPGKKPCTQIKDEDGAWVKGAETVVHQVGAEYAALNLFIDIANTQRFRVERIRTEQSAVEHLLDGGLAHLAELETEYARPIVAVAQHHGIPTRLLDWTREPLFALWFGASAAIRCRGRKDSPDRFTVWALNLTGLENRNSPLQIIDIASHHDRFINAQHGIFIFDSAALDDFYRYGRWKCLEERLLTMAKARWRLAPKPLRRFDVPVGIAEDVLELLARERVHGAALLPTLDRVAEEAKAHWLRNRGGD